MPDEKQDRRLPNFLVIGAMKAGTTSLYHYLSAHPEIFMPKIKEVDFFTEELNWGRGFDWYERQFAPAAPDVVALGEASTSYTKHPRYKGVPERIATHLPKVKLVYVVRDPIERIRSHYQHNAALGDERRPIDEAVVDNPIYVDYSRYAMQIERYLQCFSREQLLVITSEALLHDRRPTVRAVYEFLQVDPNVEAETLDQEFYKTEERREYSPLVGAVRRTLKRVFHSQVGLWRGRFVTRALKDKIGRPIRSESALASVKIPPETRAVLEERLRDDIERLRAYLPAGFDGWGIA